MHLKSTLNLENIKNSSSAVIIDQHVMKFPIYIDRISTFLLHHNRFLPTYQRLICWVMEDNQSEIDSILIADQSVVLVYMPRDQDITVLLVLVMDNCTNTNEYNRKRV